MPAPDREWRRQPAPGVEYRMIVREDPKETIFALRFAPNAPYRTTAAQARDQVYDLSPTNGRATLSEIVRRTDAEGGINGDFFQWGDDPGGDPVDLMVRNGELMSVPDAKNERGFAYGWGSGRFVLANPTWQGSCSLGPISALNAYTVEKGFTLSTASAGYAISKKPATFVVLNVGTRVLTPRCAFDGTVMQVVEDVEKLRVNPGTVVLSTQTSREALRLPLGRKVHIDVRVNGFDWHRIDNVMGGGPLLVRGGKNLAPTKGEFNETRHPRSVVGRDRQGGLWFVVIDGRQPQSTGASLTETADVMLRLGCIEAMNLDGGGSSTLRLFGLTLNRPSGGVERPVGNAILWHGPHPSRMSLPLRIVQHGDRLVLVDEAERPASPDQVIWSAEGKAAWVDGDGTLHVLAAGEVTVAALLEGRRYETRVTVKP